MLWPSTRQEAIILKQLHLCPMITRPGTSFSACIWRLQGGLNNAELKLAEAREKGDFALVKTGKGAGFHGSVISFTPSSGQHEAGRRRCGHRPRGEVDRAISAALINSKAVLCRRRGVEGAALPGSRLQQAGDTYSREAPGFNPVGGGAATGY